MHAAVQVMIAGGDDGYRSTTGVLTRARTRVCVCVHYACSGRARVAWLRMGWLQDEQGVSLVSVCARRV